MHSLAALRYRDFRLFWIDTLFSSTGRWADVVVIGWLTLELTDSPLMVGIVAASKMAGYIAAPFMGVVADRVDRLKLLRAASGVNLTVAATMLLLYVSGALALWHIIALALVSSLTWAMDNPSRNAFLADSVQKEHLPNAIALNMVAIETTVVAGPALGGLLIPVFGTGGAYGMIASLFVVDLLMLLQMKSAKHAVQPDRESPVSSLLGGLRYAWSNQTVFILLLIAFLLNLLTAPYRYTFFPLFARYVLDVGPTGYGMLTAMAGVGALVSGLTFVALGNVRGKGRLLIGSGLAWSVTLLLFAVSTSYTFSLALSFLAGIGQAVTWTVVATLILSHTESSMRGRVMGLRTGVVISLPFGNFLAGAAAERFGAPLAQGAYAVIAFVTMLAIALLVPRLRRLE